MNSVTTITNREPVPVTIGSLTLWCENFKASAVRSFTEEPVVSGGAVFTGACPKAMKLTFSGRICGGGAPLDFVKTASDMLRSGQSYTVAYRGLVFTGCRVQSFNTEDNGEDFVHTVITIITAEPVAEEGECMNAELVIKKTDGTQLAEVRLLGFTFRKNAYLPYTLLNARLCAVSENFENSSEIFFYIGQKLVHHGLIDSLRETYSGGSRIVSLVSRGFTSLLCQNQIEPGMKSRITFNQLMDGYYNLPYVTHEDNSAQTGYIYVSGKSTMWEGVVNLSYKFCGTYPYIRGDNCVRITPVSDPAVFTYSDEQLISRGFTMNGRRLISNYHMADMGGEYGTYELEDAETIACGIIRHKYSELDREFLYDPDEALAFYNKVASRMKKVFFCSYSGYNGEDLSDILSFGSITSERIKGIEIRGTSRGIVTELSVYHDKF